jgi:hypothetical protein
MFVGYQSILIEGVWNRELKKILVWSSGLKSEIMTGGWRKRRNTELHDVLFESRKMKYVGIVA